MKTALSKTARKSESPQRNPAKSVADGTIAALEHAVTVRKAQSYRVSVILYDADIQMINDLREPTGIVSRSAIIRFAVRELQEHYDNKRRARLIG